MTVFVKVVFPLEFIEEGFPPISVESLNARMDAHGYVLDNTPFFAVGVARGDRVEVEPISDKTDQYAFKRVVASSSNKALSIILLEAGTKELVYQQFRERGCYCEYGEFGQAGSLQMLAVSIPGDCDYEAVTRLLDELEAQGRLSYAELAV